MKGPRMAWLRRGPYVPLVLWVSLGVLSCSLLYAQADPALGVDDERQVTLVVGQSISIQFPRLIKVIDIRTPDVVTGRGGRSPDELRITAGERPGLGEILVVDETGRRTLVRVRVIPDITQLRTVLELAFPGAKIELHPISDTSVVLSGYVEDAQTAARLEETVQKYGVDVVNALQVGGPQQVQLKLVVAEISRDKLRQLGLDFRYSRPIGPDDTHDLTQTFGFLGALDSVAEPASLGGPIGGLIGAAGANIAYRLADSNEEWIFLLRALKEEGIAQMLAEPVLVSTSGRPASFLDGGEFAILVPQPTAGGDVTFTVEFRTFGVRLNFLPTVVGDGRIRLQIAAEVSEPDQNLGASFAGSLVPGLRARRAETSVTMRSGQTLAMAGLLHTKIVGRTRKTPVLGDLPLIGSAFRVVEHAKEEREIVILITPEVVAPMWAEAAPAYLPGSESRVPTDKELFLEGRIESLARDDITRLRRQQLRQIPPSHVKDMRELAPSPAPTDRSEESGEGAASRPRMQDATRTGADARRKPIALSGPIGFDVERE